MGGYHYYLKIRRLLNGVDSGPPPRRSYESEVDEARWRGVALDGIATIAPYGYSALDPKSMEERGIRQSRRKPKFPYVSFHARTRYGM